MLLDAGYEYCEDMLTTCYMDKDCAPKGNGHDGNRLFDEYRQQVATANRVKTGRISQRGIVPHARPRDMMGTCCMTSQFPVERHA